MHFLYYYSVVLLYNIHPVYSNLTLKFYPKPSWESRDRGFVEVVGVKLLFSAYSKCLIMETSSVQLNYLELIWSDVKTKFENYGTTESYINSVKFEQWTTVQSVVKNKLDSLLLEDGDPSITELQCDVRIRMYADEKALVWWLEMQSLHNPVLVERQD